MYAKIIDGNIQFAKRIEKIGGEMVNFPTEEQYRSIGFLPVRFVDYPDDGKYYEESWEEADDEIVRTWTMVELPDEVDEAEAWNNLFGEG